MQSIAGFGGRTYHRKTFWCAPPSTPPTDHVDPIKQNWDLARGIFELRDFPLFFGAGRALPRCSPSASMHAWGRSGNSLKVAAGNKRERISLIFVTLFSHLASPIFRAQPAGCLTSFSIPLANLIRASTSYLVRKNVILLLLVSDVLPWLWMSRRRRPMKASMFELGGSTHARTNFL
jgi:hypothetical protein